ncbi:MAG: hypothetical protein RRA92_10450 [Gemmatimonadota bacterium]|nr:hypothetical protein [Gemmatimonadota bacterium]
MAAFVCAPIPVAAATASDTIPAALARLTDVWRRPPSPEQVERVVAEILGSRPDSASEPGAELRIAVAAAWRRAGKPERALAWLDPPGRPGPDTPLADLERARALLQIGADEPAGAAARAGAERFRRACERMDERIRHELWTDLRGLATPAEQAEWTRTKTEPGAPPWNCARFRRFVAERAWRAGLSEAERLAVHYGRLHEARRLYGISRPGDPLRDALAGIPSPQSLGAENVAPSPLLAPAADPGLVSTRSLGLSRSLANRLGRPAELELEDRGLVYLRLGPPDRTASYLDEDSLPNESWSYDRPGGVLMYHFVGFPTMVLAENLSFVGASPFNVDDLYRSRMGLDVRYARIAHQIQAYGPGGLVERDPLRIQEELHREYQENWAAAEEVVTRVPDVPAVEPRVRVALEALRFADPASGEVAAWFVALVRTGDLARREGDTVAYRAEARLALRAGAEILEDAADAELARARDERLSDESGLVLRLVRVLPPGTYPFTLVVREPGSGKDGRPRGNWLRDTLVAALPAPALPSLSDIAFAPDSGGSWTRDGVRFLRVSPAHLPGPDGAAHVYFEAYGLSPGGTYDVELRLVDEGEAERGWDLDPAAVAWRLAFAASAPAGAHPVGRHHVRLELGGTPRGRYELAVRVRDHATGRTSLTGRTWVEVP